MCNCGKEWSRETNSFKMFGKFWDAEAAKRYKIMVSSELAKARTLKQIHSLNLGDNDTVFNIGCGVGILTAHAAKHVRKVYALDISKEIIIYAKRYARAEGARNIEFIHKNFEELNADTIEKADVSLSYNSLGVNDLKKCIEKLNRITIREVYIFTFANNTE